MRHVRRRMAQDLQRSSDMHVHLSRPGTVKPTSHVYQLKNARSRRPWNHAPGPGPQPHDSNGLLASLLAAPAMGRLLPQLSLVRLEQDTLLHDPGSPPATVFFPIDCTISLSRVLFDGRNPELTAVGREGMVGIAGIMSADTTGWRAIVVNGGHAWRIQRDALRHVFTHCETCQRLLLRYLHALMMDISHGSLCNAHHLVQERLCRLLLQMEDKGSGDEINATHELLASRLGVRRESISEAAFALQSDGMIRYGRGRIRILDRTALEALSCECYALIKAEYDGLTSTNSSQATR
jgi:CRP-like cAMP-binding protein